MLSSIRLRNFKSFADQQFPLGAITLLLGENGAGKSSVVQALLLIRQSLKNGNLRQNRLSLNGELCSLGTGVDLLRQGSDEEQVDVSFENTLGHYVGYSFKYDATADTLELMSDFDSISELEQKTFTYLTAERVGPRLTSPRSITRATDKDLGIHGEGALAVLEHYRSHILDSNDPRRRGRSGSLEEVFQSYLADISPNARVDLRAYNNVDNIGSTFSFSVAGGLPGSPFRPTNVGFGLSYSLAILVACLVAEPGSMLIVENPEAHLHTRSQRAICDLLCRTAMAGTQVIIETHSREIFHWLRSKAADGSIPSDLGCINYIEAIQLERQRVSKCTSLVGLAENLKDWPQNFYDAYGSPTDLIVPITPS